MLDMRETIAEDYQMNSSDPELFQGVHYDDYHVAEYSDLLDSNDFELIEKTVVQRYSMREIAEDLGITEEAAKKRKQRATERLRRKYFEET